MGMRAMRIAALAAAVLFVGDAAFAERPRRRHRRRRGSPPAAAPVAPAPAEEPAAAGPPLSGAAAPGTEDAPTTPAGASAAGPDDPARFREARSHFDAGRAHYGQHAWRDAIREFELARSRVPSADLAFNIARCHEQLNEYDAAIQEYERYLREKVDPPDREPVTRKIASLRELAETARVARRQRPDTALLRVTVSEPAASVRIDARVIGQSPIADPIRLAPGDHAVSVTKTGFRPFAAQASLVAGGTGDAIVNLERATTYETIRGSRLWTYVAGALAVGAAGGGVYFGASALGRLGTDEPAARKTALVADGLYASAVVLFVGAVALYFLEGSASETRQRAAR